jgi:hypothetical protein
VQLHVRKPEFVSMDVMPLMVSITNLSTIISKTSQRHTEQLWAPVAFCSEA